jgi:hypothetical protein
MQIQNFEISAGDDLILTFQAEDASSPDPTLYGATIKWWAARSADAAPEDVVIEKSTEDSPSDVEIVDPEALIFTVTLHRADTIELFRDYYHECQVIDAEGKVLTVTAGTMTVRRTLIRPELVT